MTGFSIEADHLLEHVSERFLAHVAHPCKMEELHQASEGLGIMAHLTPGLMEAHAQELLRLLSEMP